MAERPIFVVGYQRSGTTLLQSLLGAHPRIAAPPEIHFWFRIVELHDHWGDLLDDDRAAAVVHEVLDAPLGMLDDTGFDEARVLTRFLASDRSYAELLNALMTDFAEQHGKQRWSEKTPHQRPARIWSLLPESQVLHIVRDPRDVAASEAETFHRMPAWRSAERCAHFTTRSIEDAARQPAESYLRLRYEDLASEPAAVMRSVCDFLGEDFPPDLVTGSRETTTAIPGDKTPWQSEAAQPIRPPRSSWTSVLSPRQRALVAAAVDEMLPSIGYAPAPSRLVATGRLLGPTTWPARWMEHRRRSRITRTARTPAERHAAVRTFMTEQEGRWSS